MKQSKTCSRCLQTKAITEFYRHSQTKDKLQSRCKHCSMALTRDWEKRNPEKMAVYREVNKAWRIKNKDSQKIKQSKYQKQHKEEAANRVAARRVKIKQNGVYKISPKELKKLSKSNCFYCNTNDLIQLDHIIPVSRGGSHGIGNLVPACRLCNRAKDNRFIMEWRLGRKAKRFKDNSSVIKSL